MKKNILLILLLTIAILIYSESKLNIGGGKIAKVNNYVITEDELSTRYNMIVTNLPPNTQPPSKKEILDELVKTQLISQDLKTKKDIVLNQDDFNNTIKQQEAMYTKQKKTQDPNYNFSEDDFKNYVEKEFKVTYEKYLDTVKDKLLFDTFIKKRLDPKVALLRDKKYDKPSDFPVKDITTGESYSSTKDFYDRYMSKYFVEDSNEKGQLVPLPIDKKMEQKKKIEDMYNRIKKGDATFDDLCVYSDDTDSKNYMDPTTKIPNKGYIGPIFLSGENVKYFREMYGEDAYKQMATFEKGKYYLVESTKGYHIFYVLDKKETHIQTFEEAQPVIVQAFKNFDFTKLYQDEVDSIISDLRKKANIVYYVDEYKPAK